MSVSREDDWRPLTPDEHERQVAGLLELLGPPPRRVVDLGAGAARIAAPLHRAGHHLLAIDRDPEALERCRAEGVATRRADLTDPAADLAHPHGPADALLCLGHTFNLFADPDAAIALMRRLRDVCDLEGWLAIDDSPDELWRQVASGDWQEGISEDGTLQMVWAPGDNAIAIREGDEVDDGCWSVREDDRLIRLWSWGELRLLAEVGGWAPPIGESARGLVLFRPIARP